MNADQTPLEGAIVAAREASQQSDQLALLTAALLAQAQNNGCQHHHPTPAPQKAPMDLRKVAVIGGAVVVGGAVLTGMFLAIALTACSVAICALVLKSILTNQKGK